MNYMVRTEVQYGRIRMNNNLDSRRTSGSRARIVHASSSAGQTARGPFRVPAASPGPAGGRGQLPALFTVSGSEKLWCDVAKH